MPSRTHPPQTSRRSGGLPWLPWWAQRLRASVARTPATTRIWGAAAATPTTARPVIRRPAEAVEGESAAAALRTLLAASPPKRNARQLDGPLCLDSRRSLPQRPLRRERCRAAPAARMRARTRMRSATALRAGAREPRRVPRIASRRPCRRAAAHRLVARTGRRGRAGGAKALSDRAGAKATQDPPRGARGGAGRPRVTKRLHIMIL